MFEYFIKRSLCSRHVTIPDKFHFFVVGKVMNSLFIFNLNSLFGTARFSHK